MATSGNQSEGSTEMPTPVPPYFDASSSDRYSSAKTLAKHCALGKVAEVETFLKSFNLSVRQPLDVGGAPIGWTCLMFACRWLNPEVISYLVRMGSDLNIYTTVGMTPLVALAVASNPQNSEKSVSCAKILVDAGANVSHPLVYNRRTALTMAVSKGTTELVEFLLESEANPNIRDGKGETVNSQVSKAFNIAVAGNLMEIAELLITYGANPYMKNLNGEGCHDLAARIVHPDAAEDMMCYLTRILNKVYRERYRNMQPSGDMLVQVNRECQPIINTVIPSQEIPTPVALNADEEDSDDQMTSGEGTTVYDENMVPTLSYEYNNSPTWIFGGLATFAVLSIAMFALKK